MKQFLLSKLLIGALSLASINSTLANDDTPAFPESSESEFYGYQQIDFKLDKLPCKVVIPKKVAEGKPWIIRARFWGHWPVLDQALLAKGFHVAYADVAGLFGAPRAVERWNRLYDYLTTEHGLSQKVALEGMSRGGLIIYNWAKKNPEKVSCIYGDNPVCDFKSWPTTKSRQIQSAYQLTQEEADAYQDNPIDNLGPLAEAGVPLFNVVGDLDDVVPVAENTAILEERYKALGGKITVLHKPDCKHHPHGLGDDPTLLVEFILANTH